MEYGPVGGSWLDLLEKGPPHVFRRNVKTYSKGFGGFAMIHILLAAYNEEKALGDVLNGIARTLADGRYKIWVVDDGSTDGTVDVLLRWRTAVPLVVVRHEVNKGLGAALLTGFSSLIPVLFPEDVVVTLDADNTHSPVQIPALVDPIECGHADIVVASRFVPGARLVGVPVYRQLLSSVAAILFRFVIPIRGLRDYTCGYRAYRGDFLKKGQEKWGGLFTEKGFAAVAEIMVKLGSLRPRVRELPLILRYDRKPGASKMILGQTILRNIAVMIRLRRFRIL
jgi:dolichol-phosphate mannosyltransferase